MKSVLLVSISILTFCLTENVNAKCKNPSGDFRDHCSSDVDVNTEDCTISATCKLRSLHFDYSGCKRIDPKTQFEVWPVSWCLMSLDLRCEGSCPGFLEKAPKQMKKK